MTRTEKAYALRAKPFRDLRLFVDSLPYFLEGSVHLNFMARLP